MKHNTTSTKTLIASILDENDPIKNQPYVSSVLQTNQKIEQGRWNILVHHEHFQKKTSYFKPNLSSTSNDDNFSKQSSYKFRNTNNNQSKFCHGISSRNHREKC